AIGRVRHWLEHDPVDEQAWRWLLRLLALGGDRAGALQAYRQCADTLRRELAEEPSAETVRLYERIRDAPASPPVAARAGEGAPAVPALVGRQTEWSRLREAWERAAGGQAGFALVSG